MFLEVLSDNPFATNCWAVSADASEEAVVVDPGFFPEQVLATVERAGKRLVAVLATHGHVDHIGSAREVCGGDVPLYIHESDELALTDQRAWGAGIPVEGDYRPTVVRSVSDGDLLEFAGFRIRVLHTPGHTPGSVCFVTDGFVLSGDLVFRGTIGRYDFANSDEGQMMGSLRRFLSLPDELDVYPGHLGTTTVGEERRSNPFLVSLAGAWE
ncbi:MAG TPA: MBL fold metallo-hydrolase [Actinomycetota bacterium]|jgi:hydroxyacylglutathione hydrolase|nr:MBL fold metallo-hydrolase [Actinomycetota bacterium]